MSSEPQTTLTTLSSPSLLTPETGTQQRTEFSPLTPSARTSFTRVDLSENTGREEQDETPAIEPTNALEAEVESLPVPQTPQVLLTFLLVSGRRRNMTFDPETTVGRVKELAWNAWPNEWQDDRPPAPSYLRILYLGKILQDDDTLTNVGFPTHILPLTGSQTNGTTLTAPVPTIVHLSIRSHPPVGTKDTPKKMNIRRNSAVGDDDTRSAGCCAGCVVC